jgi:hypothetical protein
MKPPPKRSDETNITVAKLEAALWVDVYPHGLVK